MLCQIVIICSLPICVSQVCTNTSFPQAPYKMCLYKCVHSLLPKATLDKHANTRKCHATYHHTQNHREEDLLRWQLMQMWGSKSWRKIGCLTSESASESGKIGWNHQRITTEHRSTEFSHSIWKSMINHYT